MFTMSKKITPFTAQLVTFDTPLPVAEVILRLEKEVSKSSSAQLLASIAKATSKEELEITIKELSGGNDFL